MRKLLKTEKYIIACTDSNYTTYDCPNDGVFQLHKSKDDGICRQCKNKVPPMDNVDELQKKFKEELKIN